MSHKSPESNIHWSTRLKSFAVLGLMGILSSLACGTSAEILGNVVADCIHPRVDDATKQLSLDTANCLPGDTLNLVLFQQLLANYISATHDLYINPSFFAENIPSTNADSANVANAQDMSIRLDNLPDTISLTKIEGDDTFYVPTRMVFFDPAVEQQYTVNAVVPVDIFVASMNSATVRGVGEESATNRQENKRSLLLGGAGLAALGVGYWLYAIFRADPGDTSYVRQGSRLSPAKGEAERYASALAGNHNNGDGVDTFYSYPADGSSNSNSSVGANPYGLGDEYTGPVNVDIGHLAPYARFAEASAQSISSKLAMATPRNPKLAADAQQAVKDADEIVKLLADISKRDGVKDLPIHRDTMVRVVAAMEDKYNYKHPSLEVILTTQLGQQIAGVIEEKAAQIHDIARMVTDATEKTIAHMSIVHGEQSQAARGVEEIKTNVELLQQDIQHSERVKNSIPPGRQ
ncbi:hypothetical protein KBD69_02220 [Candidatus Woesebacteria bacterium]|nr:hypothetical protein [Candidatus Woesebacteria bacterium]